MKNIQAFWRGYLFFRVNNKHFFCYQAALEARKAVPANKAVIFNGFHVFKGWTGFYSRVFC